jgi:hypothetical protein
LLSGEDQSLLVRRNSLLVLDLGLNIVDGVGGLDLKGDGLARKGLDEAVIQSVSISIWSSSAFVAKWFGGSYICTEGGKESAFNFSDHTHTQSPQAPKRWQELTDCGRLRRRRCLEIRNSKEVGNSQNGGRQALILD